MEFQLYMLTNRETPYDPLYVAHTPETARCISIHHKFIDITEISKWDEREFKKNYIKTSRSITIDIKLLDTLSKLLIGQEDYCLTSYFEGEDKLVFTYKCAKTGEYIESIFPINNQQSKSSQYIRKTYELLIKLREITFNE